MKYKLIKKYPGSPSLGTIVSYSETHKIYNYNGGDFYTELPKNQVENLDEFWEPVEEKDLKSIIERAIEKYPIKSGGLCSYFNHNENLNKELTTELFDLLGKSHQNIYGYYPSDNPTQYWFPEYDTYSRIELLEEALSIVNKKDKGTMPLGGAEHVKEPLFQTEDGVDIYDYDCYWIVNKNPTTNETPTKNSHGLGKSNNLVYFSDREKAQEYIEQNKPQYSTKGDDLERELLEKWRKKQECSWLFRHE